jgi:hypothetical protein
MRTKALSQTAKEVVSGTVLQNTNPSETIRRADIDGESVSPPVIPNNAQNCFAKIQMSIVAAMPSIIAALMVLKFYQ